MSRSQQGHRAKNRVRVYFAGPLFTQAEWQWNARLATELEKLGFDVFLPQTKAEPMLTGRVPFDPQQLFQDNVNAIEQAEIVLAVFDQPDADSGTCWECGYAYKLGRSIVGLRTDIRRLSDGPKTSVSVNLMLAQSCRQIIELPLGQRDDLVWVASRVAEALRRHVKAAN